MSRIEELRKLLLDAKKAYYSNGNVLLSDEEYDSLEEELRSLSPNDSFFSIVGADTEEIKFPKAKHSMPMGSQSKCANEDEFTSWWNSKNPSSVLATYKIDGASLALYYENGKLIQAITRGNGKEGRDITPNAIKIFGVKPTISETNKVSIRGEVVLTVDNWKAVDPSALNPRNLGTGIMSREDGENCDKLRFIAFDISIENNTFNTEKEKMQKVLDLGFQATYFQLCNSLKETLDFYNTTKNSRKDSAIQFFRNTVWIDGLVLKINNVKMQESLGEVSGHPKWSVALKFPSPAAITTIEGVEYGVGHTGAITPVALLKSVEIGGTNVSRVTLNNWDYIDKVMQVAIGDTVKIVKGGDIIPKLIAVVSRPASRKAIKPPTTCPVCGGLVERERGVSGNLGTAIKCSNENCPAKCIGKVKRLVKKLEILEIGSSIIEAMFENKIIKTIADLFRIEKYKNEIATLNVGNGVWGLSRTEKMIEEVNKKKNMTLDMFLGILGINGLGQRRAKIIMNNVPGEFDTLADWRSDKLVKFADKAGVPNLASSIVGDIENMKELIDDLLTEIKIESVKNAVIPGKLNGKSFVLTGSFSRKKAEIHADILAAGGIVGESLDKNTTYLVQADPASASSKTKKAEKYGIKIISEEELMAMM